MRISLLAVVVGLALGVVGCSKRETVVPVPVVDTTGGEVAVVVSRASAPAPGAQAPDEAASLDLDRFSHVFHEGGRTYVVLSQVTEDSWGKGAPALVSADFPVVVRRDVDVAALPGALARRSGRHVRLVGAAGVVCQGVVGPLSIVGRFVPHFGTRSDWEGKNHDIGEPDAPLSADEIAHEAWNAVGNARVLAAEIISTTGDCKSALFARAASLPAPAVIAAVPAPPALADKAVLALRRLPSYAAIEQNYRQSSSGGPGRWEVEDGSTSVTLFRGKNASYVWVFAYGGEACSDFDAQMASLWKVEGEGSAEPSFTLVHEGDSDLSPDLATDIDGDGSPELIGHERILRRGHDGYAIDSLDVPSFDCPC
jgi:hypothetical protein